MRDLTDIEFATVVLQSMDPAERIGVCAAALTTLHDPAQHAALRDAAHKIARHADSLERHDCLAAFRDGHCRPEGVNTAPGNLSPDPAAEWDRGPFSDPFSPPAGPPFACGAGSMAERPPRASFRSRAAWARLKHLMDRVEHSLVGDVLGLLAIVAMVVLLLRAGLGAVP